MSAGSLYAHHWLRRERGWIAQDREGHHRRVAARDGERDVITCRFAATRRRTAARRSAGVADLRAIGIRAAAEFVRGLRPRHALCRCLRHGVLDAGGRAAAPWVE